jgi:hypothetical protein
MALLSNPTFQLQPAPERQALATNYITNFDFLNQYLPDTYEKEFERYGNRSVASFLRMVGAEMPSNSDLIKWAEQGRLHTKYVEVGVDVVNTLGSSTATLQVNDVATNMAVRLGQTVLISFNSGAASNKAVVISPIDYTTNQFDVAFYEGTGYAGAGSQLLTDNVATIMIYGSEFGKGTSGMQESLEAEDDIFENKPIIIKDKYSVSGSDMAQIGWIEVTTENGASGYLWYLKSEHETRLRFEDYLETAMIEAVPAEAGSGALVTAGLTGSEGLFYAVEDRGNVFGGGNPTTLAEFDSIIQRLDKQGAIEENVYVCKPSVLF